MKNSNTYAPYIGTKEYYDYLDYLDNSVEMKTWERVMNIISDDDYDRISDASSNYIFSFDKRIEKNAYNYIYRFIRKYDIRTADGELCTVGHFVDVIEA